jgi:redoxin
LPSIDQVHGEWEPRGVTVVLVNIREDRAKVARVVAQRGYAAPVALDLDGSVSEAYGIHATPMAFVVTRDGQIVGRAIGPRPWTGPDARALFRALLAPPR